MFLNQNLYFLNHLIFCLFILFITKEQNRTPSKKSLHVSAHSLNKTPEWELDEKVRIYPSTSAASSIENNNSNNYSNNKFDSMKVYTNLERTSLIESIDLETKSLKAANSGKRLNVRRHTHYYCYIPSTVAQATSSNNNSTISHEDLSRHEQHSSPSGGGNRRLSSHALRRFMAKKVSDTWHSAVRVKKILSDSLPIFK